MTVCFRRARRWGHGDSLRGSSASRWLGGNRVSALWPALALAACAEQPKREVWAMVTSIAPIASRWNTDQLTVAVRSPDGAVGMVRVSAARLHCHVGDTVRASARGVSLTLADGFCER